MSLQRYLYVNPLGYLDKILEPGPLGPVYSGPHEATHLLLLGLPSSSAPAPLLTSPLPFLVFQSVLPPTLPLKQNL
jgi:hypothetical protein